MASSGSGLTFCLLLVALADPGYSTRRILRSWLNPGCKDTYREETCQNVTMLHLRADGANDTLHYLWDFVDKPSMLLVLTNSSISLNNITWEDYLARRENSLVFSDKPTYSFGVIINKIIEFNDINDTALIDTADVATNVLDPKYFNWRRVSLSQNDEFVYLDMEGNSYHDTAMNIRRYGSIKLSFRGFCTLDHSNIMPHMLHTENSTQVDIIFDHLQTNEMFSNSRFAIELLVVGGGDPDISVFVDPKKNLDDEHTPGIFEVIEVRTPPFRESDSRLDAGAYLQWRPVSYNNALRDITGSTGTIQYPPKKVFNHTSALENSMLYCYYNYTNLLLQKLTISLGSKGDGFYKKTNYLTWTFIVGYGTPPEERFSYLVIMIISIGLGLPLFVMTITGMYLCIRRMPKRQGDVYLSR